MRFEGMQNGEKIYIDCWGGRVEFSCDLLGGDKFDSLEKIEQAISKYGLSLRKNFGNKTAYKIGSRFGRDANKIIKVEVTSVTEDGKYAWIKAGGARQKENIETLFSDEEELQEALDFEACENQKIKTKWASVKRWTPANPE